jgi:hypothetical protein
VYDDEVLRSAGIPDSGASLIGVVTPPGRLAVELDPLSRRPASDITVGIGLGTNSVPTDVRPVRIVDIHGDEP